MATSFAAAEVMDKRGSWATGCIVVAQDRSGRWSPVRGGMRQPPPVDIEAEAEPMVLVQCVSSGHLSVALPDGGRAFVTAGW